MNEQDRIESKIDSLINALSIQAVTLGRIDERLKPLESHGKKISKLERESEVSKTKFKWLGVALTSFLTLLTGYVLKKLNP